VRLSDNLMRFQKYFQRYGALETVLHLFKVFNRSLLGNQTFIFFVNLCDVPKEYNKLPLDIKIEYINSEHEIKENDLTRLTSYWVKEILYRNIKERFKRSDTGLWVLRVQEEIVAFLWSTSNIQNRDWFFPYTDRDMYLFDHVTLPEHRGKRYHSILMQYVLYELKKRGFVRCFMYVFKWNKSSLKSVAKMDWKFFGTARKFHIFNKVITIWG